MRNPLLACLPALTCLLALSSCGGAATGPDKLNDYLSRLSNVVGTPQLAPAEEATWLDLPDAAITIDNPATQIDLIDFLSLSGCALQVNLGRHNTQLGRTASPSQRLLLDLEFLELAPACIERLRQRGDDDLADTLLQVSKDREAGISGSIVSAVLAGPEWQQFWERPASLGNYPSDTNSQIAATLAQLRAMTSRWLAGDWTASNRDFELRLSELRAGDGGALLMAYSQVQRTLDRATQLISQVTGAATLCPYGQPTERSRAVEQIVAKYFAGGVQPWLVALRQRQELLLPPIQSLEGALEPSLSPPYDQWRRQRDQLLQAQPQLIRDHVQAIQLALADCR